MSEKDQMADIPDKDFKTAVLRITKDYIKTWRMLTKQCIRTMKISIKIYKTEKETKK